MSRQKELLRELAAAHNSRAPDRNSDWFTEDFRLHEPGSPVLPTGYEGASRMRARIRALTPPIKLEIFDIDRGRRSGSRALSANRDLRGRTLRTINHGNLSLREWPHRRGLGHLDPGTLALMSSSFAILSGGRARLSNRTCSKPSTSTLQAVLQSREALPRRGLRTGKGTGGRERCSTSKADADQSPGQA
jgi:hypothetical protein